MPESSRTLPKFLKSKWTVGIVIVILLVGGYWFFGRSSGSAYQFISVTQGSITETVSATGNTTPMQSVSLGFQNTGTIAHVYYNLGDQVSAGAVIASLTTASLSAALSQAQANLAVAQANLSALTAGTRPEQLAIDQSAVTQDQIALANAITSAYTAADGAVHTSADQIFTNARTANAMLVVNIPNATLANQITQERIALEPVLAAWSAQVASPSFSASNALSAATQAVQSLTQVSAFLNDTAAGLTQIQPSANFSAATLTTYETSIASARTSIAGALTALTSANAVLTSAEGTLTLAQAGSTPQGIAAQQAQVEEAQAGVASAEANLGNATIIAPISGVLTQQDAKVGQQASPGVPLVSIIGNGGFEVDTGVSDTDVGKLATGDAVTMTLDAFPGETFMGSVFYIAPAETDTQGVITYLVKISFTKSDSRLKSGLTANITIQAKQDANALILPQYAILQNDSGTFVETLLGKTTTTTPVTLGIQDESGNVEVLSGVTLGEQVINIGLKAQ